MSQAAHSPSSPIHVSKHHVCTVAGCSKPSHGGTYCDKHKADARKGKRPTTVISREMQAAILSDCCSTLCTRGDRHPYGEQYCGKCAKPCCWKTPVG